MEEDDEDEASSDQFQQDWLVYLAACRKLLEATGDGFPRQQDGFISNKHGLLQASDPLKSPAKNFILVYDHRREKAPEAPLFESFANDTIKPRIQAMPFRWPRPSATHSRICWQLDTTISRPSTAHRVPARQRWCCPL